MTDLFGIDPGLAVLSECSECPPAQRIACVDRAHRPYRYQLERSWLPDGPRACWIMLNPSTATAEMNDPTIGRCVRFSSLWGMAGLTVVNLHAWRAVRVNDRTCVAHRGWMTEDQLRDVASVLNEIVNSGVERPRIFPAGPDMEGGA